MIRTRVILCRVTVWIVLLLIFEMINLSYFILRFHLCISNLSINNCYRTCDYVLDMLVCDVGGVFRRLIESKMEIFCCLGV